MTYETHNDKMLESADKYVANYSAPVGERSIVISLSVCLCLSVREHISGTTGPILAKFSVQIPGGRGLVLLWQRCFSVVARMAIAALRYWGRV